MSDGLSRTDGAVGNNLIVAPPRHPAILWAAICAKRALEERHNETIWGKTGPGLLTRAVAWHIQKAAASGNAPSLRILPRWQLGRIVQFHSPLSYKSSKSYWNRQDVAGALNGLAAHLPPV
ncbi:hypothetical protein [Paracoccus cavernae]|uniref:hypothetical protein n=1 Tax=Paracoccus cavernae TaxID=1571207 RepID=UPI00360CAD0C